MDDINKLEENKLFELYILAELAYQKHFKSNRESVKNIIINGEQ